MSRVLYRKCRNLNKNIVKYNYIYKITQNRKRFITGGVDVWCVLVYNPQELPNQTIMKISRTDILTALTESFEEGDLSFLETVNNITFGYKAQLKHNLNKKNGNNKDS